MKHKALKNTLIAVLAVVLVLVAGGLIAVRGLTYPAGDVAKVAMAGDDLVRVTDGDVIAFEPKTPKGNTGVVFYPGALVSPEAYSFWALRVADAGYPVYIVKMPLNLAVLSPLKGEQVMADYPQISKWVVGGHSLGGAMVPKLLEQEGNAVKGLFFMAAYPADDGLKDEDLNAITIWGDKDGVADLDKVINGSYPKHTTKKMIEGGNHAGFGDYGDQKGDNPAGISNTDQMNAAAQAVINLIEGLS